MLLVWKLVWFKTKYYLIVLISRFLKHNLLWMVSIGISVWGAVYIFRWITSFIMIFSWFNRTVVKWKCRERLLTIVFQLAFYIAYLAHLGPNSEKFLGIDYYKEFQGYSAAIIWGSIGFWIISLIVDFWIYIGMFDYSFKIKK